MNTAGNGNDRSTMGNRRRSPALVVLLYVVFAGVWIVASGNLVSLAVEDPDAQSRLELIKGLLFVVVTGGLLYILLRVWGGAAPDPVLGPSPPALRRLAPAVILLALFSPVVSFAVVEFYGPQVEKDKLEDLQAIADLKSRHIENWLDERRNDGASISGDNAFIARIAEWQRTGAERQRELVRARLESLRAMGGYDFAVLFDARRRPAMTLGYPHDITAAMVQDVEKALSTGILQINGNLVRDGNSIYLDIAFPLHRDPADEASAIGAVFLRLNAHDFLLPFVREWPTASRSGETILVSHDGAFVNFVSDLRHDDAPGVGSSPATFPVSDPDLPVTAVRSGDRGTVRGADYRGAQVLAAYRRIPGTDWHLISKIDRDEILGPVKKTAFWIGLVAFVAVSAVGAAMLLFWRQERRMYRLELQAQSDRLLANFYNLPFIGMAITLPETKRWIRFNDQLCATLGYSREELAEKTWVDIVHPEDVKDDLVHLDRFMRGEIESYVADKRYIRKDGGVVFARLDVRCVRRPDGSVDYFVATIQDVTERVRAMAEIAADRARIKATFMGTVDLAMKLVDMRDPYTTGHERRVADIAVAVGREMGFDEGRLEGVRIAAELHDVGNVKIPLDILIKPSRLSAVEFEFIKAHAGGGYEILKDVEFPWPVAEVALRHHERWNGSGYPDGLKGDAVCLEVRIVAVADVVEAMASHRPYRPALGADKALTEIEGGRGTLYDPDVADACLRLFREKGYAIPD